MHVTVAVCWPEGGAGGRRLFGNSLWSFVGMFDCVESASWLVAVAAVEHQEQSDLLHSHFLLCVEGLLTRVALSRSDRMSH